MVSVVPASKKITEIQKAKLALSNGIEIPMLKAFFAVEANGIGFSDYTGRILIQFEPKLMRGYVGNFSKFRSGWINNGVSNQTIEYQAFEQAKKDNEVAAMKATSIGMGQILGMHYQRLGFDSVFEMWKFFDLNEFNQASGVISFIKTDWVLYEAVKAKNTVVIADRYNGKYFRQLAERLGIVPYDIQMQRAYDKFKVSTIIYKTKTTVNIRSGAGTNYAPIALPLQVNTVVEKLDEQNSWTKVEVVTTGIVGWVKSEFIS